MALRHNGVSAIDGGFLQILMTAATGNTAIEQAARAGCLGGEENIPPELKSLEVRFGELCAIGTSSGNGKSPSSSDSEAEGQVDVVQAQTTEEDDAISEVVPMSLQDDHDDNESASEELEQTSMVTGVSLQESQVKLHRRAGFGTADETLPLRRRYSIDQHNTSMITTQA